MVNLEVGKMKKKRTFIFAVALVLILTLLALSWETASANTPRKRGEKKKEVKMYSGNSYDISIGNGGVFFETTYYHNVTAVLTKTEAEHRGWRYFTQDILSIYVYDSEGDPVDRFVGLVQIYFELDVLQRMWWDDPDSNMSIWFKDLWETGTWVKCPSFLVKSKVAPRGRVVCFATDFGEYGIAWTWPTVAMKLEKAMELLEQGECLCSDNYYNCEDFETQADAQKCFAYCKNQVGGDIHGLDTDLDGTACEE
jgi:hypothetical protein